MIKKPLWKVVDRAGIQYAEMLLRCHADEFQAERERLEEFGTVKRATEAILSKFAGQEEQDLSGIIHEIKRQHEQQLDALKSHLKEHFSQFIYATGQNFERAEEAEMLVDDVWESIES